ncbi:hypothetical protein [Actinomadura sp. 3N407]|uniref:hypothetical protein n=1 Tax=Actinomadura sp. 3N407 TaxID=3457423 RepID=UPI003FCC3ED3
MFTVGSDGLTGLERPARALELTTEANRGDGTREREITAWSPMTVATAPQGRRQPGGMVGLLY